MQNSCSSIEVVRYSTGQQDEWDAFVLAAKNGHFFFSRNYMDYHADRFQDYSLMFYQENRLVALLPANRDGDSVFSHQGLTYGGIVCDEKMTSPLMLLIFQVLVRYLAVDCIKKFFYKPMPYIFLAVPGEEALYALFRLNAQLYRRDLSSAIYLPGVIKYSKGRKWSINKARKHQIVVRRSNDFSRFMQLLAQVLWERHQRHPVHSAEEMQFLAVRFPERIKLYAAYAGERMLAGSIVFENDRVVHTQYMANSVEGREYGALDLVIDHIINVSKPDKQYLNFGVSTENEGRFLNNGLVEQKESFGARAVLHDFYLLDIQAAL